MAAVIDPRLLEAETEQNLTENFNRVLALVDNLADKVRVPKLSSVDFDVTTFEPEFDADTLAYTGETGADGDQITVTAEHSGDTVTIASEDATVAEDGAITWAEGVNVLTITVVNGFLSTVYTFTVTYTPE